MPRQETAERIVEKIDQNELVKTARKVSVVGETFSQGFSLSLEEARYILDTLGSTHHAAQRLPWHQPDQLPEASKELLEKHGLLKDKFDAFTIRRFTSSLNGARNGGLQHYFWYATNLYLHALDHAQSAHPRLDKEKYISAFSKTAEEMGQKLKDTIVSEIIGAEIYFTVNHPREVFGEISREIKRTTPRAPLAPHRNRVKIHVN